MPFVKRAYDIARKKVFFCNSKDYISEVSEKLHENNVGSILVKENEKILGIITVNDILRQISKKKFNYELRAKDIMSSPVVMAHKDLEIDDLVEEFNKHKKVSRLVLVDDKDRVVGIVRDIAVFKYLSFYKYDEEVKNSFARDYLHNLY